MVYAHNKQVRVAVLDDHPMVRTVFELCLKHEPDIHLVGTGLQVMNCLVSCAAPRWMCWCWIFAGRAGTGWRPVKQLRNHYPQQKILISSSMESPAIVKMVLSAGVKGFIGKSHNMQEIVRRFVRWRRGGYSCHRKWRTRWKTST